MDIITLALAKKYTKQKILEASLGGEVDLSEYAKKAELPSRNSQLENDAGFITKEVEDLQNYLTKKQIQELLEEVADAKTVSEALAKKLDAPGGVKAGDYLRVQSIGADGTVVLEGAEAPGGGSGQNATLTTAQINTLAAVINAIDAFNVTNGQELIDEFNAAWGISGDPGGDDSGGEDSGGGDPGGDAAPVLPTDGLQAFFDFRNAQAETTPYTFSIAKTAGEGVWYANVAGGSNGTNTFVSDNIGVGHEPVIVPSATTYPKLGNSDVVAQMPFTVFIQGYNTTLNDAPLNPYRWVTIGNVAPKYSFTARYVDSTGTAKVKGTTAPPSITGQYTTLCLSTCTEWARLYIDGTLAAEVLASDCEDFASWDAFNGATQWGYGASDVRRAVSYAVYNRALTDVEIVEATEYLKTLEVTA